ncbi:flavodoxin domain-containing protein [Actinopolymorpha singaporensis]
MVTTRVLVAYATRNRATAGIAERIGADLISAGLEVQVAPAKAAHTVKGYDACVLGSAIYAGRSQHDARRFGDEQAIDSWARELARELGADGAPAGRPAPDEPSS